MSKYEIIGREWAAKHGKRPLLDAHLGWLWFDAFTGDHPACLPDALYAEMNDSRHATEGAAYTELGIALTTLRQRYAFL